MIDLDNVQENLAELLTNTVDMAAVFYDIFLNPEPMDVSLQMFDDNNELITVTIPNRAKDRITSYIGEGSPEGVIEAPIGSTYVDTATSTVYYKVSGSDSFGWNAVISQSLMETFIRTYLEARGYVTTSALRAYLLNNKYVTENDTASENSYGVVKIDNKTIQLNGNSQIAVNAILNSNVSGTQNNYSVWVGKESDYLDLVNNDNIQSNKIYIITDNGQIIIGSTQVACNGFPSDSNENLSLLSSGSDYTATADGWFLLNKTAGVANAKLEIVNNKSLYASTIFLPATDSAGYVICPALKGEKVTITYTATGATNKFIFIKAASNDVA